MKNFNKGSVQIEFVLVLPILIMLSFGAFEVHRFITLNTSLKTAAYSVALWGSRDARRNLIRQHIDVVSLDNPELKVGENASIIVTGITAGRGTQNLIKWSVSRGTGTSNVTSSYPILYDRRLYKSPIDSIIVEVSYNYTPLFFSFASKVLRYQVCVDYRGIDFPQS